MQSSWASRVATVVLIAALLVWVCNALVRWYLDAPLGHDEARYALDAKDWLAGASTRFVYSGEGMTLVAIPGVLLGETERALRLVPMLMSLGFLGSVWLLARRLYGRQTAAWTLAVLATSPQLAVHSSELLSDLPSAACLMLAMSLLIPELTREDGLRWRVCWAAPLCGASFYLRFGSCITIAIIGIALAILGHRNILRRPWPIVTMLAVFGLLLVPHAMKSIELTGSATGILQLSAQIPGEAPGIAGYLSDPVGKYGVVIAALMIIGTIAVRRRGIPLALQAIAISQVLVLAWTTQAQPRFIYVATVLLVIVGVDAVGRALALAREHTRAGLVVACSLAICASWLNELGNGLGHRELRLSRAWRTHLAAEIIRTDRDPHHACEVITADDATRLEWYSGCRGEKRPSEADGLLYEVRDGFGPEPSIAHRRVVYLPTLLEVIRFR